MLYFVLGFALGLFAQKAWISYCNWVETQNLENQHDY